MDKGQKKVETLCLYLFFSQRSTVNSQQSTVNGQQPTVNSQWSFHHFLCMNAFIVYYINDIESV